MTLSLSFLLFNQDALAQKSKKSKGNKTVITDGQRQQSALFADGLREFYAGNYEASENTFRKVLAQNGKNDAGRRH